MNSIQHIYISCCSHLEHRASVKRFVSLQFLNPKTVGRIPWTGDQPIARPLAIQTQNKHRQTSMPWVGFELTIPAFERAKTVHALDRAATVIGSAKHNSSIMKQTFIEPCLRVTYTFHSSIEYENWVHIFMFFYIFKDYCTSHSSKSNHIWSSFSVTKHCDIIILSKWDIRLICLHEI
jgi:hypothetical protein